MPFIGNQPAEAFSSFQKQDFTTSATTSYTLDNPVANENEIALFINFVRQEPTTAYSASGTTLTLTSATSASDDMYCVYLGKAVQTVNPPSGSVGTSQLDSSLDFSSKTITLASNMKNTPSFLAYQSTAQVISTSTTTVVSFNTEVFDTDNCFASNKFTPTVAGKYFLKFSISYYSFDAINNIRHKLIKNGSTELGQWQFPKLSSTSGEGDGKWTNQQSVIVEANGSSDYFEVNTFHDHGTNRSLWNNRNDTFFTGFKIIE